MYMSLEVLASVIIRLMVASIFKKTTRCHIPQVFSLYIYYHEHLEYRVILCGYEEAVLRDISSTVKMEAKGSSETLVPIC
jgi:hypothetical protein